VPHGTTLRESAPSIGAPAARIEKGVCAGRKALTAVKTAQDITARSKEARIIARAGDSLMFATDGARAAAAAGARSNVARCR